MAESRTITVIFSAQDDYSVVLGKFNKALQDTSATSATADTALTKISSTFKSLQSAWLEVAAVVAGSAWLIAGAKNALDAEVSYNKLRIQIDNLGKSYAALEPSIQASIDATAEYAIVQNRDVSKVLQQLILQTGTLETAQKSLNIVYDLAYLKNIDVGEAVIIYSKAIAGNTEGLSRLFPELKHLDELMGANATQAQKGAVAQQFITDKVKDATEKMTEHEREIKRVTLAYNELWLGLGSVALELASLSLNLLAFFKEGAMAEAGIGTITDKLNLLKISVADVAGVWDESAKKTWKDMAAGIKAASDATEHETASLKAYVELNKPLQEEYNKLTDEINKATLSKEDYLVVYALEQIAMGKDMNLINALIDVKRQLNTIEEQNTFQKNLEAVDKKIADVNKSIATTTGNTTDYITALVQEIVTLGATTEQVIAYTNALQKEAKAKETLTAENDLLKLSQESIYSASAVQAGNSELLNIKLNYDKKFAVISDYNGKVIQAMINAGKSQSLIESTFRDLSLAADKQMAIVQLEAYADTAGMMSTLMANAYAASGDSMEAFFYVSKALAVAQAIISAHVGAAKALEMGPILGIPAASLMLAIGYANAAIIAATAFIGGGASTLSTSTGITTADTATITTDTSVPTSTTTTAAQQTQSITVVINNPLSTDNWQQIVMDNIIPAINDATDRNVYLNVRRS